MAVRYDVCPGAPSSMPRSEFASVAVRCRAGRRLVVLGSSQQGATRTRSPLPRTRPARKAGRRTQSLAAATRGTCPGRRRACCSRLPATRGSPRACRTPATWRTPRRPSCCVAGRILRGVLAASRRSAARTTRRSATWRCCLMARGAPCAFGLTEAISWSTAARSACSASPGGSALSAAGGALRPRIFRMAATSGSSVLARRPCGCARSASAGMRAAPCLA